MEINKKEMGKRIRSLRNSLPSKLPDKKGKTMSMEEFGALISSGKSNVSRWERGENVPNVATLQLMVELAKEFDIEISVEEILYGTLSEQIRPIINIHAYYNDYDIKPENLDEIVADLSSHYEQNGITIVDEQDVIDDFKKRWKFQSANGNIYNVFDDKKLPVLLLNKSDLKKMHEVAENNNTQKNFIYLDENFEGNFYFFHYNNEENSINIKEQEVIKKIIKAYFTELNSNNN